MFKLVCDFKLMLLVNGIQTAVSTCPCPYCFITLNDLRKFNDLDYTCRDNSDSSGRLKTYGDLKNDFLKFKSLNKEKKLAATCHSTVNSPLIEEADDVCVLEKCVIPELYIVLGFFNHLFWDGLVPLLTEEVALLWPKKMNLVSKNYHGRQFEGNACRKLLKNADLLEDPEISAEVGILKLLPFINAFKAMDRVVSNSFSTKKADPEAYKALSDLRKILPSTKVSITLKLHVLLDHLKDCIDFLNGDGLGKTSEQAGESIHHHFATHWDRRKVSLDNPKYVDHLRSAVVSFSSLNL